MSTLTEIKSAIARLSAPQVDALASRRESHRTRRASPANVESWLAHARGVAVMGTSTAEVMRLTRGEE